MSRIKGILAERGLLLDKAFEKIHYKTLANGNRYIYLACPIPLNIKLAVMDDWMFVWFMASA